MQVGWSGWRKVSGVICKIRVAAKEKRKVYRRLVRPAMLFDLEMGARTKREETELDLAELKML